MLPAESPTITPLDTRELAVKTRSDLGWDELLAHLAARAHTDRGAAAARALDTSLDLAWIRTRLAETDEARALHDGGEPLPFGGISDVEPALARAEKGGHLDGGSLREIAATLRGGADLRRHLGARIERAPRLAGRVSLVAQLDQVSGPVDDAFDDGGGMRDTASPALGGLRKKAGALHEELGRRAKALLDDASISPHLQDRFYTQRDERYVIPIRADARTRVKGIVHGTSGSGQTVFVEPEEIVDLNNRLKLAELEVDDEERRILGELTLLVVDAIGSIRVNLEILTHLDLVDAGARLGIDLVARTPEVTDGDGALIDLRNARHPLMVLAGKTCVPNDVVLARGRTLVVSGPNAGGKTVALKTTGLLALMVRAGLPIPAQEGSSMPLFEPVLTDVGDEQSIERNLSTFSAHVLHLNAFLDAAGPRTLILLDEIAVGTDPEQGAALAQAVLEELAKRVATVVVTTHYDRLKALGANDPRFANASVGFDLARLAPTYKLHLGVPGASGAIVVARRLGLPGSIASRADTLLGDGVRGIDELLAVVERERERLTVSLAAAEAEKARASFERREAERLTVEAREKLANARRGAHDEAIESLKSARMDLDRARADLKKAATPEIAVGVRKRVDQAAATVAKHAPNKNTPPGRPATADDLVAGAEVWVPSLGGRGTIVTAAGGKAQVQVGALKLSVAAADLLVPERRTNPPSPSLKRSMSVPSSYAQSARPPAGAGDMMRAAEASAPASLRTPGNTLDLRGERVDMAIALVEKFVDDSLRRAEDVVFLIHGHGTGALRSALREHLATSPGIASMRPGDDKEGGDGVTVLTLA